MTFIEEASIKILSGLLSNPSVVQRVDEAGNWSLGGNTKDLLILVVHIAKELQNTISADFIENDPLHIKYKFDTKTTLLTK
jgi:hypothetical protein